MKRLLAALCLAAVIVCSQEFRATLTGRVTDPSSAPVNDAAISVTNEGTNVVYSAKTDSRGNSTVPLLPPGSSL